jgi:hypothetical protein
MQYRNLGNVLIFTVVPSSKLRSNVSPAGTVNELMFTVVHLTALETSDMEEMVPVQAELACVLGAASTNGSTADKKSIVAVTVMVNRMSRSTGGGEEPVCCCSQRSACLYTVQVLLMSRSGASMYYEDHQIARRECATHFHMSKHNCTR